MHNQYPEVVPAWRIKTVVEPYLQKRSRKIDNTYRAFHGPLLHPDGQFSVVKHAFQVVLERKKLLVQALTEDVDFMLELSALGAHPFSLGLAVPMDLGRELTARGPEKIGGLSAPSASVSYSPITGGRMSRARAYILHVLFRYQPFTSKVQIDGQQTTNGFHERNALLLRESLLLKVPNQGVGVKVVDIAWRMQTGMFLGCRVGR